MATAVIEPPAPEGFVDEDEIPAPPGFIDEADIPAPEGFVDEIPVAGVRQDPAQGSGQRIAAIPISDETPAPTAANPSQTQLPEVARGGSDAGVPQASGDAVATYQPTAEDATLVQQGQAEGRAVVMQDGKPTLAPKLTPEQPSTAEKIRNSLGVGLATAPESMRQMFDYAGLAFFRQIDPIIGTNYANELYGKRLDATGRQVQQMRDGAEANKDAVPTLDGFGGDVAQAFGQQFPMLPLQLGVAASAGLKGALAASASFGGLQSASGSFAGNVAERTGRGESLESATNAEFMPSVASGLITAATTTAFGTTGIESIFREKGAKVATSRLFETLKQGGFEVAEEVSDESAQILNDLVNNKGVTVEDALKRVGTAAAVAGIMGTGVVGLNQAMRDTAPKIAPDNATVSALELGGAPLTAQALADQVTGDGEQSLGTVPDGEGDVFAGVERRTTDQLPKETDSVVEPELAGEPVPALGDVAAPAAEGAKTATETVPPIPKSAPATAAPEVRQDSLPVSSLPEDTKAPAARKSPLDQLRELEADAEPTGLPPEIQKMKANALSRVRQNSIDGGLISTESQSIDPAKVSAYASKLPEGPRAVVRAVLNEGASIADAAADAGMTVKRAQEAVDKANKFLGTAKTVEALPSERSYTDEPSSGRTDEIDAVARTEGSGAELGPGAANIEEPVASYEARRFGERFQEDKSIDPAIRDQTGNRYYEPISNKITVAEAEKVIERRGTDESVRLVRDESFPMDARVRATVAQSLIKKLNQSHEEAVKAGDTKAAEGFINQAVDTAEYLSELGTKLGQGVQAFAIWSRLTPEGMLMAARRGVKKAVAKVETESGPAVQEIVDAINTAPAKDRVKIIIQLGKKNPIAKKVIGKAKQLSDAGELTKEGFYKIVSKELGLPELSKDAEAKILKMAREIAAAPEGFQRNEKTADLLSFMAELKGVDVAEVPTAIWYANILSGYSTQLVNTLDTALNVLSESAAMAASHPTATGDILGGLYRGLLKGGVEAKSVLTTGRGKTENKLQTPSILERTKFGTKGGVPISEKTALGRVMKSAFESKPASVLNLWKFPLRAMVASDTVMYNSYKEARARVLARAMAKNEGLSGDALFQRVDEILNRTEERVAAAQKQAQEEGLTGNRYDRRVQEIEEQGRPEELVNNADEAAQIATYNHDPTGILGVLASKVGGATNAVPAAKFIVPFTRIVANVSNRGLDYTPYGYKRLFFGQHGGERFATERPVGEAYRTQLIKATAGTLGMAAVAAMDAAGLVEITSRGPEDGDDRKQLQSVGWKPYSVKIGDTWVSYQYSPLNLGFTMVGNYRDALRYNKIGEKDAATRLAYGMLKASSTIFDMSFLSGLNDFMETVTGAASSTKSAGKLIARTASSIVTPNLVKQIDKLFDPTAYEANTVTQALIRETPVARSTMLRPMLNVLGEPVKVNTNRFFSNATDDPVWKFIVDKQAFVSVPSKTAKIRNRPITEAEYYRLVKESGPKIRSYIQNNLARLNAMTAEQAQDAVQAEAKKARDSVKKNF